MERTPLRAVLYRVGWTKLYDGTEEPIGGGKYNEEYVGAEVTSFLPHEGHLYGFVSSLPSNRINLHRVDPSSDADPRRVDLVVWTSTAPDQGGQRVIGWYRNALVHAQEQPAPSSDHGIWQTMCRVEDAVLLPANCRTMRVPTRGEGRFGQANLRYLHSDSGQPDPPKWWDETLAWIDQYEGDNLLEHPESAVLEDLNDGIDGRQGGQGFCANADERRAIEHHAMREAIAYLERDGWELLDRWAYKSKPYDLVFRANGRTIKVEVKGTTGRGERVLVTRREVESAQAAPDEYALVVVKEIELTRSDEPTCSGGETRCIHPFEPSSAALRPLAYEFRFEPEHDA